MLELLKEAVKASKKLKGSVFMVNSTSGLVYQVTNGVITVKNFPSADVAEAILEG